MSWQMGENDGALRHLVGRVLSNLYLQPRNRSRLYRAELRAKQMQGWKEAKGDDRGNSSRKIGAGRRRPSTAQPLSAKNKKRSSSRW